MSSSRTAELPSYEETLERLGRATCENAPPGHGVYRKRTEEGEERPEFSSDQPATISHTTISPSYLQQPQPVFLPCSPAVSSSYSPEPPGHYTKAKRYKKSTSRSNSKRDAAAATAYDNQMSADYWASASMEQVTINTDEPIVLRPMVTRVGADGRTYLRDTSIVVVQHEEHETPNTKIVYGTPAMPNEYRWYAILAMVFCFVCGVFSFRRSKQVRQKFQTSDIMGAQEASASARNWGNAALVTGALIIIVVIFLFFVNPCPLARAFGADDVCPRGT